MYDSDLQSSIDNYFSSCNPLFQRIWSEQKMIEKHENKENESYSTSANDETAVDIEEHFNVYPKLSLKPGQNIVFDENNENDSSWRDEHSKPFCWETQSQLDFSFEKINKEDKEAKRTPKLARKSVTDNIIFKKHSLNSKNSDNSSLNSEAFYDKDVDKCIQSRNSLDFLNTTHLKKNESDALNVHKYGTSLDTSSASLNIDGITAPSSPENQLLNVNNLQVNDLKLLDKSSADNDENDSPIHCKETTSDDHVFTTTSSENSKESTIKTGFDFLDNW